MCSLLCETFPDFPGWECVTTLYAPKDPSFLVPTSGINIGLSFPLSSLDLGIRSLASLSQCLEQ